MGHGTGGKRLGFAYRAVTIWQVGILHVACIAIQMWLLLNQ